MKSIKTVCSGHTEWRNEAGQFHRVDGPAIEHADGTKYWYLNGKTHREDGPAVEYADGYKVWYLKGKHIDCSSQEEFEQLMKLKAFW